MAASYCIHADPLHSICSMAVMFVPCFVRLDCSCWDRSFTWRCLSMPASESLRSDYIVLRALPEPSSCCSVLSSMRVTLPFDCGGWVVVYILHLTTSNRGVFASQTEPPMSSHCFSGSCFWCCTVDAPCSALLSCHLATAFLGFGIGISMSSPMSALPSAPSCSSSS